MSMFLSSAGSIRIDWRKVHPMEAGDKVFAIIVNCASKVSGRLRRKVPVSSVIAVEEGIRDVIASIEEIHGKVL